MACSEVPDGPPTSPSNPGSSGITTKTRKTCFALKNKVIKYNFCAENTFPTSFQN